VSDQPTPRVASGQPLTWFIARGNIWPDEITEFRVTWPDLAIEFVIVDGLGPQPWSHHWPPQPPSTVMEGPRRVVLSTVAGPLITGTGSSKAGPRIVLWSLRPSDNSITCCTEIIPPRFSNLILNSERGQVCTRGSLANLQLWMVDTLCLRMVKSWPVSSPEKKHFVQQRRKWIKCTSNKCKNLHEFRSYRVLHSLSHLNSIENKQT